MTPRATMRLQLHKDFTFTDATALVPYLIDLGISHVYIVTDPDRAGRIDPRLRRDRPDLGQSGAGW